MDIGYSRAYKCVRELGVKLGTWITPHWFRAQRASQLALEYGLGLHELAEWFRWKNLEVAMHYSRFGYKGLAMKMRRPTPPRAGP